MKRVKWVVAPLVLVGAVIGGVAWFLPDLLGMSSHADEAAGPGSGLFCDEHGVPERFCTLCHPNRKETLLLCPEHGDIPEDICTKCHPDVREKHDLRMCPKGHGLPEHFCIDCGTASGSAGAAMPDDGWCATHNRPESRCTDCQDGVGVADAKACRQPLPLVRLASAELAKDVGLETAEVVAESHGHELEANAETAFDANRYADVSPRVAGFVRSVAVDLGDRVEAGQVLAVVDSAEVSAAKAEYLAARAEQDLAQDTFKRVRALAARDAASAMEEVAAQSALNRAKAGLWSSRQKLKNYRFSDDDLDRIEAAEDTSSELPLVAPLGGTIVARHAVLGEAVGADSVLYSIADTSKMWLWIDVYEGDVDSLKLELPVTFAISGAGDERFEGTLTWLGAEVDPVTRTTRARAELSNAGGRLRANQFGRAVVGLGDPHRAIVVPRAAVQKTEGGADVVFLPDGPGTYRPQRIEARPSDRREVVEASWGLQPGDRVVTRGSFWLKTELMRGAIGAGCCGE